MNNDIQRVNANNMSEAATARSHVFYHYLDKCVDYHHLWPRNFLVVSGYKYGLSCYKAPPSKRAANFTHDQLKCPRLCGLLPRESDRDRDAEAAKKSDPSAASYCFFFDILILFREYHDAFPYDITIKAVVEMLVQKLNYGKDDSRDDSRDSTHYLPSCFICSADTPHHKSLPIPPPVCNNNNCTTSTCHSGCNTLAAPAPASGFSLTLTLDTTNNNNTTTPTSC